MRVFDIDGIAVTREKLTTATATGFTSAYILPTTGDYTGKQARAALISSEVADVRFTLEGTTPTTTASSARGHLLMVGSSYLISGEKNVANFKVVNAVASSGALLECTFFF